MKVFKDWKLPQKTFSWLKRVSRHVVVYFPPLLGFLVLYQNSNNYWFEEGSAWYIFLNSVSVAFITGGILTITMNALKYFDFFKKQLEDILLGDNFLEKRNDIHDLWTKVSRILYKRKFPEIAKKLENLILSEYLPKDSPYYSESFENEIHFEFDKADENILVLTEVHNQIVKSHNNTKINVKFTSTINLPDDKTMREDPSRLNLEFLKINENDLYCSENYIKERGCYKLNEYSFELIEETQGSEMRMKGMINLTGSHEYKITKKISKKYYLNVNPIKAFTASHIFNNFLVSYTFPKELRVEFHKLGTVKSFTEQDTPSNESAKYKYEGILLPQQGFALGLTKIN